MYPKIYNTINNFGIQNKNSFDFVFSNWKSRKQNGPINPKIINELPVPTKLILVTEMLSKPKKVNEQEQTRIVPSPKLVAETVEIKKNQQF